MANIKSAKKRIKTNERDKTSNKKVKTAIRTSSKKVLAALDPTNENHATLNDLNKQFAKTIDTAARKGVVHRKNAARKKSRITKKVNAAAKQPQAPKA